MVRVDISNVSVEVACTILGFYAGAAKGVIPSLGILEAIGLVVSISTLIIASQALNSWRNQFRHQVQYKSLLKLKANFENYWKSEDSVRSSCMEKWRREGFAFELPETEIDHRNNMQRKYQESWNEITMYCPKFVDEYRDIAPDNICKIHLDYINELRKQNFSPSTSDFYDWQNKMNKRAMGAFYAYLNQLS
ncbi:hypothetical protein GCM10007938_20980 [Vibrio zhanjiangensis]|uniref:DUF4760 domain-containing protein n=1 Tax=Vibrio zhanjiangensis TaxID=1046128 RepID=A0ABQ6F0N4_9VIBR|nr:hypothetical protein [Vibrio zhanjiangensis]GLT18320.1 hypothetical protein GCM10007938_20980 [Vibrio zhanjiangensis]